MKRIIALLAIAALFAAYGCSETGPDGQASEHDDLTAAREMGNALHHMESYNDSIAHHPGALVHHYDSLYHHHDSLFVHYHQNYHHGDTLHHHTGVQHGVAQHHEYDSVAAAHLHIAH
jgi:hypothetical protein